MPRLFYTETGKALLHNHEEITAWRWARKTLKLPADHRAQRQTARDARPRDTEERLAMGARAGAQGQAQGGCEHDCAALDEPGDERLGARDAADRRQNRVGAQHRS